MRLVKIFEYLDTNAGLDERNQLGAKGWECYAVTSDSDGAERFYFKRMIGEVPAKDGP
jgi:hypothetical protein